MKFHRFERADDPLLPAWYALFEASFPEEEREPRDAILAQIESDPLFHNLALCSEKQVIGLLRVGWLPRTGAGFLIHIAVSPSAQGQGLGTVLLDEASRRIPDGPLILEIERVEDARDEEDRLRRERRLAWFAARGVWLLTPTYTQPPMAAHLPGVPLGLHLLGLRPADVPGFLQSFYAEAFGLEPDDPWVLRAIEG